MSEEQREFPRILQSFHADCRESGSLTETWHPIIGLDWSASGMSFQSEALFEVGQKVEIRVLLPTDRELFVLYGRLLWSRDLGPNTTGHGVQFIDVTPGQQEHIDGMVKFLRKAVLPPG